MGVVLDVGALVALDKGDRETNRMLHRIRAEGVRTSCAVVAQVWRDGARQARLALALKGVDVVPLDEEADRRIGELLRATGTADVVDGHVALMVRPGDYVATSDVGDLGRLLDARRVRAALIQV
ncbi:hypothetical protein [Actinomadura sp. DC4]|uniref:hypothetical protein n=1 Tax=Actinomadura sp. DC4 TaxID=3055069 RepID=UPI0025AFD951|nr:hypothetical protein [Actinomadura sp. DC4]MDN3359354.1 hypothetical protein [Actinomadura sp. DC4]